MANKLALVPDVATLALIREGFASERQTLASDRSKCTDTGLIRLYTERIGMLFSAELMAHMLIAVAGKFDWACVQDLEKALYMCMVCPNHDTMVEAWKDVRIACQKVSAELDARSAEELKRERERTEQARESTRKAKADAIAAERQTHNWLWRVFH